MIVIVIVKVMKMRMMEIMKEEGEIDVDNKQNSKRMMNMIVKQWKD